MPRLTHYVIIPNELGEANQFPLKSWVIENQNQFPHLFGENDTTHQMRNSLIGLGWVPEIGINNYFLIKPDNNGNIGYADNYIHEIDVEIDENDDEMEDAQELSFGLERDMQRALRLNIQIIEAGLTIIDNGRERHTEAGFIDITARDVNGNIVIIELKAPIAKPEVIAQTLSYMESIQAIENTNVRGIIIANDFVDRVKLAARQIPNLKLLKYSFQFNFNEVL